MKRIFTEEHFEQLRQLKERAEAAPMTMDDLLDQFNKVKGPPGDDPTYVEYIGVPWGFRVVFTIEEQPVRKNLTQSVRHLSVSIENDDDAMPHPAVVQVVMEHLGFERELTACKVWQEEIGDNTAINVAEIM